MDDDRYRKADRLARQYRFLESHPQYQWVGSSAELIDRCGVWGLQTQSSAACRKEIFSFILRISILLSCFAKAFCQKAADTALAQRCGSARIMNCL